MTWKELAREVALRSGVSLRTTERVLRALTGTLSEVLVDDEFERLSVPHVGTFSAQWTPGRTVRSPRDQRRIWLDGRWRIVFRLSTRVREGLAKSAPQHWREVEHQTAWRLADTLVSDLEMYHSEVQPVDVRDALPDAAVRAAAEAAYGVNWRRVVKTYEAEVDAATRLARDHLADAVRKRWSLKPRRSGEKRRRAKTDEGWQQSARTAAVGRPS